MGDVDNLHRLRQASDDIAHIVGGATRDTCVNLVEDNGRQGEVLCEDGFQSQHHTRELTARCNLFDWSWLDSLVCREEEIDRVGTRNGRCARCYGDLKLGIRHCHIAQNLHYALCECRRSLQSCIVQLHGKRGGRLFALGNSLLRLGNSLVAMLYDGELLGISVTQGNQLLDALATMFSL